SRRQGARGQGALALHRRAGRAPDRDLGENLPRRLRPFNANARGRGRRPGRQRLRRYWMGSGYEIARGIEELIASGHSPRDVWRMTPRQMAAFLELAHRRRMGERVMELTILRASQADGKELKKFMRKLEGEAS